MRKNNINLRILFFMLLSIVMIKTNAQTGLNFQGVARTSNNVILASQAITIKLSILQGSATGTADYIETRRVITNAQGLFTAVIGDTGAISTLGNFTTINWKNTPKFLKIEMDAAAGTNFITMGTTQFQYVAYAQFAKSVDAENIVGIVPVTLGGTGVNSLAGLKTALTLNNVNNTSDADKIISTKTQAALDLILVTATDTTRFSKRINAKADTTDLISGLALKLNKSDTASMLSSRIARDTLNLSNRINLKAKTTDVTTGLALKENISNKSTAVDLGGTSPSDVLFPTQKAVKDYVAANNSGGGVADGGITTIKLADGAVTDAKINTVSGSKVIGNITGNAATATLATNATLAGNITATSNTTLTSLSNLNTIGTITTGTWSGTKVAIANGGTGLTAPGTAGQVLTSTSSGTLIWKSTSKLLSIGDAYQGGIIAYILQDGDPGFDATNQKGLIAATSDQSTGIMWYNSTYTTTGATGTAIGTGLSNTNTIIASHGGIATSYAAGVARAYTGGGYTDWYLPSKDELDKLFINREAIGGFATNFYWSSSEIDNDKAYSRVFSYSLLINYYFKYHPFYVRAIRAFSSVKSIEDGGTGATTASAARANLGLVIGANVQAPLVAGTNYIVPNISITGATKTKLTYDTKGLVIAGTDATTADIASSINKNYVTDVQSGILSNTSGTNTGDQTIVLTGDVTGTGTGTFTSTLANSGVSASSYGSSTLIPIFTVDAKGRITTASTASIVADAGTLTGSTLKSTVTGSSLTSVGILTSATVNGKVIVGSSTAASTSAVLEANSTTQGFLPPRVFAAQRDAIVYPVAGLTIWCINCGQYGELNVFNGVAWVNMFGFSTSSVPTIAIGMNYYGGKIAYILVAGDPGYDVNTPHGLVAATEDQSIGNQWYNASFITTGATETAIGTGLANTNIIIASQGATATSYAAGVARAYTGGGYTDWYLPSKDELNKLFINRTAIGGFASNYYWSSSEVNFNFAWCQNLVTGAQVNYFFKSGALYVRAIRAF